MDDKTIKLLLIEDNEDDALIIRETLRGAHGGRFDLEWAGRLSIGLERRGNSIKEPRRQL